MARKFNWRIQPSGDAALNLLGHSTQVPGRWVYLSDDPGREYKIGSHSPVFKKSALKDVGFKFKESGLVAQVLRALGREHVDQKAVECIRQQLESKACDRILRDTRSVTGWVYKAIKQICKRRLIDGLGYPASHAATSRVVLGGIGANRYHARHCRKGLLPGKFE